MKSQKEIWRDIIGFENFHQVSNQGRIRSLDRQISRRGNICNIKGKILKLQTHECGYKILMLRKHNTCRHFRVHRLVVEHFIGKIPYKMEVNHKNGIKSDNQVENLEIVTRLENARHSFRKLGRASGMKGKFGKDCPNSKAVLQFSLDGKFIKKFYAMAEATRETGVSCVSDACRGKRNTAGGYKWRYVTTED